MSDGVEVPKDVVSDVGTLEKHDKGCGGSHTSKNHQETSILLSFSRHSFLKLLKSSVFNPLLTL